MHPLHHQCVETMLFAFAAPYASQVSTDPRTHPIIPTVPMHTPFTSGRESIHVRSPLQYIPQQRARPLTVYATSQHSTFPGDWIWNLAQYRVHTPRSVCLRPSPPYTHPIITRSPPIYLLPAPSTRRTTAHLIGHRPPCLPLASIVVTVSRTPFSCAPESIWRRDGWLAPGPSFGTGGIQARLARFGLDRHFSLSYYCGG